MGFCLFLEGVLNTRQLEVQPKTTVYNISQVFKYIGCDKGVSEIDLLAIIKFE